MTGLVLKLAPKERVLINGAVIENGDRRGSLSIVTKNANILRLRDAIHPDQAKTPVSRLCYAVQLILSGDVAIDTGRPDILRSIEELSRILTDGDSARLMGDATDALLRGDAYPALRALRRLLPREARLLNVARPQ